MIRKKLSRYFLLIFFLYFYNGQTAIQPWRFFAQTDLKAIHTAIIENHPASTGFASKTFQKWFQPGFIKALKRTQRVHSYQSYLAVLHYYADGFQDEHLYLQDCSKKISFKQKPQFSISTLGQDSIWISIPTFQPHDDKNTQHALNAIAERIINFRNKSSIILDLRGNTGGNARYGRAILRSLYGDNYIASLRNNSIWNKPWRIAYRVSQANVHYWRMQRDANLAKRMQTALLKGKVFIFSTVSLLPKLTYRQSELMHAPKAKVYLVTDEHCSSACWLFVRSALQLPNVTLIGQATHFMSRYTQANPIVLPSRRLVIYIPTQVYLYPLQHFGKRFIPHYRYKGDISKTEMLKRWVISTISIKEFKSLSTES